MLQYFYFVKEPSIYHLVSFITASLIFFTWNLYNSCYKMFKNKHSTHYIPTYDYNRDFVFFIIYLFFLIGVGVQF